MIRRIGAVARKELTHLIRDPWMLAIVFAMPIIQLLLFAYAMSFDVRNVPMMVIDTDHTPASRQYTEAFAASGLFDVVQRSDRAADVDDAFASNSVRAALIIPAGFGDALARGGQAQAAILVDGSQPNTARVARAASTALSQLYGQQIAVAWAAGQGVDLSGTGGLEPRLRMWYNPDQRSSDFVIPGLMVVILAIVTVQQTAVTLVRERSIGTAEQLTVSPLRRGELMFGKLLPWTGLAFVDVAVITVLAIGVFGVPLRGSIAALAVGAVLFIFASLGLGLVISAVAPSLDVANLVGLFAGFLPAFLLSGFAFPLSQIPTILQWIATIFPAQYMVTISRDVFLKGASFPQIWPSLLALGIFAAVTLAVSSVLYRRRET